MLDHMISDLNDKFLDYTSATKLYKDLKRILVGDEQVQSIKIFSKVHEVLINKPDNLENLINVVRSVRKSFDDLCKNKEEELWKCIFISSLSEKHSQLRSVLVSNEANDLEMYFKLAIKEQQIYQTTKSIKVNQIKFSRNNQLQSSKSNPGSDKSKVECFECGKDHKLEFCVIYKQKRSKDKSYKTKALIEYLERKKRRENQNKVVANLATNQIEEVPLENRMASGNVFQCSILCNINRVNSLQSKFYLDSGATDHVVNNVYNAYDISYKSDAYLSVADGTKLEVTGICKEIYILPMASHYH